jgi:4a-hydroxytetrahydrobiopterin dehydratase
MALAEEQCQPVTEGTSPLSAAEAQDLAQGTPEWVLKERAMEREFGFQDFQAAIAFVNQVADVAEEQDHHPDIHISYRNVLLALSTHKIGGLSRNDFILAAKIDQLA